MTDPLDALYASLEAGDVPLAVVADAYEDAGSELAAGVRWLADEGRMPRVLLFTEPRFWYWSGVGNDHWNRHYPTWCIPYAVLDLVKSRTGEFPTLRAAIEAAAEAVTGAPTCTD